MSPDSTASDLVNDPDGRVSVDVTAAAVVRALPASSGSEQKPTVVESGAAVAGAGAGASMEMDDESFQGDASAFTMSLDELAAANPPDQLYEDLTGESAKSPAMASRRAAAAHNNQIDHQHDETMAAAGTPRETVPASIDSARDPPTKLEQPQYPSSTTHSSPATSSQSVHPAPSPSALPAPLVATRKSPRRSASTKAATATTKKATGGTKRGSQSQSPSQTQSHNQSQSQSQAAQSFSWNDILHVQNLIERCLQQLLSKNDIVLTLQAQAKVDPAFTAVVWQKLEEQNPAFFRAYAMQLQLKEQITAFNFLVSQQKEMMAKASGNAAFMSFLASSDARKTQQRQAMMRSARMASVPQARGRSNTPSPHPNTVHLGSSMEMAQPSSSSSSSSNPHAFSLTSPLPLPSPMKTDLDTHAFFS